MTRRAYVPAAVLYLLALTLAGAGGCHRGGAARPHAVIRTAGLHRPVMPPLPPGGVKGIHLTGWVTGDHKQLESLIGLCDRTELNAMVVDIKDDGQLSYDADIPLAKEIHASLHMIPHIDRVVAEMKQHHIFPIARIACFRDTILAKAHPELAVHTPGGAVWYDATHHAWLNPYKRENWDYNVDVALDAIKQGFEEVQFDYVRFASEGKVSTLVYPGKPKGGLRADQIEAFLKYAAAKIHAQGAWFSADVFGLSSLTTGDMGIGQTRTNVAGEVDFICPMTYPSHYAHGEYGIPNPNTEPYKIVHLSLVDALKRIKDVPTCQLRPWLQDFSLYHVHYGPEQVKAELKAAADLGIHQFLLWNASCHYTEAALAPKGAAAGKAAAGPRHTRPGATG
ncbi:MAG: putative glycoside hydrolase [Armatimonadetes bacterium]|nr:putative glycoside hydrolase [Armatimonadota bacterium]MDE2207862.1 putative glycoside hydrolase [Armatimonadota bacterium]